MVIKSPRLAVALIAVLVVLVAEHQTASAQRIYTLDFKKAVQITLKKQEAKILQIQDLKYEEFDTFVSVKVYPDTYDECIRVNLTNTKKSEQETYLIPSKNGYLEQPLIARQFPWQDYCKDIPYNTSLQNGAITQGGDMSQVKMKCDNFTIQLEVAEAYKDQNINFTLYLHLVQRITNHPRLGNNIYMPLQTIAYSDYDPKKPDEYPMSYTIHWPLDKKYGQVINYNFYYPSFLIYKQRDDHLVFTATYNRDAAQCDVVIQQVDSPIPDPFMKIDRSLWSTMPKKEVIEQQDAILNTIDASQRYMVKQYMLARELKAARSYNVYVRFSCITLNQTDQPAFITVRADQQFNRQFIKAPQIAPYIDPLQNYTVQLVQDFQFPALSFSDHFRLITFMYTTWRRANPDSKNDTQVMPTIDEVSYEFKYDTKIRSPYVMMLCQYANYTHEPKYILIDDYYFNGTEKNPIVLEQYNTRFTDPKCTQMNSKALRVHDVMEGMYILTIINPYIDNPGAPFRIGRAEEPDYEITEQEKIFEIDTTQILYFKKTNPSKSCIKLMSSQGPIQNLKIYLRSCYNFHNKTDIDLQLCKYLVYKYNGYQFDLKTRELYISSFQDWVCPTCTIILTVENLNKTEAFYGSFAFKEVDPDEDDVPDDVPRDRDDPSDGRKPWPKWAWYVLYGSILGAVVIASFTGYGLRLYKIHKTYREKRERLQIEVEIVDGPLFGGYDSQQYQH